MKIGLDLHGMLLFDTKFFSEFTHAIILAGGQIHIMTGSLISDTIKQELQLHNINYTHIFSIAGHYKDKPGIEMWYDEENRPWVSDELWNKAKGEYAKEQGLDLVLDDTAEYAKYFSTSFALCTIVNKSGKERRPKAKMPPKPLKHPNVFDLPNKQ